MSNYSFSGPTYGHEFTQPDDRPWKPGFSPYLHVGAPCDTPLSSCCGAPSIANTDLCSACKEHAVFYTDE